MYKETKIIICKSCGGDGVSELKKKGYNESNPKCKSCNGTGKQLETTTIEWKPYPTT
jgi:DnaJ-class molecular chaperone